MFWPIWLCRAAPASDGPSSMSGQAALLVGVAGHHRDDDRDDDEDRQQDQGDDRQAVAQEALADQLPVGPDRDEVDLVDLGRGADSVPGPVDVDALHRSASQYLMRGSTKPYRTSASRLPDDHDDADQHARREIVG